MSKKRQFTDLPSSPDETLPVPNALPNDSKHVFSSPSTSPAGPPPAKKSRYSNSLISSFQCKRPGISNIQTPRNSAAEVAGFPEFVDGDVEILLPGGKRYQLHKAMLVMNSKYFRETLDEADRVGTRYKEGREDEGCVKYRYRIKGKGQDAMLVLQTEDTMDSADTDIELEGIERSTKADSCINCGRILSASGSSHTDRNSGRKHPKLSTNGSFTPDSLDKNLNLNSSPPICHHCGYPRTCSPEEFTGSSNTKANLNKYIINAYDNLFLIFYNFSPVYIHRNSRIPSEQSYFSLLNLATHYGCLRAVSHRLNHDLYNLGDTLWLQIFWDPISYLNLSLKTRSLPIFKESTIHIIGRGDIISQKQKLLLEGIPENVLGSLEAKYNETLKLIHATERQIRSINYPNDPTPFNYDAGDEINWLALSLFRSYESDLTARIYRRPNITFTTNNSPSITSPTTPSYPYGSELAAEYFRILHAGGERYLSELEIGTFLSRSSIFRYFVMESSDTSTSAASPTPMDTSSTNFAASPAALETSSGFRRDVYMLKEVAKEIVKEMCRNESKIPLEELEKRGCNYLTCIIWKEEEVPWWGMDGEHW